LELENRRSGTGVVTVGKYVKGITFISSDDIAFSDTDEAFSDTDPLFGVSKTMSQYLDSRTGSFAFNLTNTSGSFGFRYLGLDIAEV